MTPTLTTPRLTLRPMRLEDWDGYHDVMTSQRAVFMGGPYALPASWGMFCTCLAQWDLFGFGALMIEDTASRTCVGQIGVNSGPLFPEWELGWLLFPEAEGRGFAREAAAAMRDWARDVRQLPTLVSYIDPANSRSIRLAEQIGARLDKDARGTDPADLVYRHFGRSVNALGEG
ncbi:GNAT family N-acetyltransferase [Xanthobacter sp. TB0136]|uniref:GNAT family N-acetyltransferase n=1 Tax=Xanthobacter sp. TB0136 TaxID=3459177 RepID=UPI00403963C3